ncbi:hypothetical protein V6N13_038320 [Hibiscus sabdariffa]
MGEEIWRSEEALGGLMSLCNMQWKTQRRGSRWVAGDVGSQCYEPNSLTLMALVECQDEIGYGKESGCFARYDVAMVVADDGHHVDDKVE